MAHVRARCISSFSDFAIIFQGVNGALGWRAARIIPLDYYR
jgi:hypothetical protein